MLRDYLKEDDVKLSDFGGLHGCFLLEAIVCPSSTQKCREHPQNQQIGVL